MKEVWGLGSYPMCDVDCVAHDSRVEKRYTSIITFKTQMTVQGKIGPRNVDFQERGGLLPI